MKRPVSCKNRLAIKTMKCEKKLFKCHLHYSEVRKMCRERCNFYTLEDGRQHATSFQMQRVIGFLAVTSSWGYQHGFSAETSHFLSKATLFLDYVANNIINF